MATMCGPLIPAFAQDVWLSPENITIDSINHAARELKARGKFWDLFSVAHHRRAALIQEKLKSPKITPLIFPSPPDFPDSGAWTLTESNTLIASPKRFKKFPQGKIHFIEDKMIPPNRAYLKLWEALTFLNHYPKKGELCLDLGASPGGWSWVLSQLGAEVIAVDKAALEPKIAAHPKVQSLKQSAFAVDLKSIGKIDWLCCDVICYPERLYTHVQRWLETGLVKNFVCTIKLKGKVDFALIRKFQSIPNSFTTHLFHNKHELTWLWPFTNPEIL